MPDYKIGDWVMVTDKCDNRYIIGQIHRQDPDEGLFYFYRSALSTLGQSFDFEWFVPDNNTWSEEVVLGKEVSHG